MEATTTDSRSCLVELLLRPKNCWMALVVVTYSCSLIQYTEGMTEKLGLVMLVPFILLKDIIVNIPLLLRTVLSQAPLEPLNLRKRTVAELLNWLWAAPIKSAEFRAFLQIFLKIPSTMTTSWLVKLVLVRATGTRLELPIEICWELKLDMIGVRTQVPLLIRQVTWQIVTVTAPLVEVLVQALTSWLLLTKSLLTVLSRPRPTSKFLSRFIKSSIDCDLQRRGSRVRVLVLSLCENRPGTEAGGVLLMLILELFDVVWEGGGVAGGRLLDVPGVVVETFAAGTAGRTGVVALVWGAGWAGFMVELPAAVLLDWVIVPFWTGSFLGGTALVVLDLPLALLALDSLQSTSWQLPDVFCPVCWAIKFTSLAVRTSTFAGQSTSVLMFGPVGLFGLSVAALALAVCSNLF